MEALIKEQKKLKNEIKTVKDDMLSIAKAHISDVNDLRDQIFLTSQQINLLARKIKETEQELTGLHTEIKDHTQVILFLADMLYQITGKLHMYLSLYIQLHSRLNDILDDIDSLEKGELSHRIVQHSEMKRLIDHVKLHLSETYPEYELVLEDTHHYYNLPLIDYAYEKGIIGIQIPMFIKPRQQQPLHLYHLKSIPVPYHINKDMIDPGESPYTHTQLVLSSNILGMSTDTYINLDMDMLHNCPKIGTVYFCETLFLTKHKSEHTCESAIYQYEHRDLIKQKCKFNYILNLEPDPELMDAGNHFLLSHLPEPWSVHCKHSDQLPGPLKVSNYTVILKSDMCGCEIQSGVDIIWHTQGTIKYCPNDHTKLDANIVPYYTINMAVMIYQFAEELDRQRLNDNSLLLKPILEDPIEPNLVVENPDEILEQPVIFVDLAEAMEDLVTRKFISKEDYAIAIQEPRNWFTGGNIWIGFGAITSFITIILTVVMAIIFLRGCGMEGKIQKLHTALAGFITGIPNLPMVSGHSQNSKDFVTFEINGFYGLTLSTGFVLMIIIIIWLLYKIIKYICKYYDMYNLSSIQTKKSWHSYMEFDKTHIYMQFSTKWVPSTMEIYLGTYFGNPEDLEIRDGLQDFQQFTLSYEKHCLYDYININWTKQSLALNCLELQTPTFAQVPLLKKKGMRDIFNRKENVYCRLVAYNPSTCKIRALGKFQACTSKENSPDTPVSDSEEDRGPRDSLGNILPAPVAAEYIPSISTVLHQTKSRHSLDALDKFDEIYIPNTKILSIHPHPQSDKRVVLELEKKEDTQGVQMERMDVYHDEIYSHAI